MGKAARPRVPPPLPLPGESPLQPADPVCSCGCQSPVFVCLSACQPLCLRELLPARPGPRAARRLRQPLRPLPLVFLSVASTPMLRGPAPSPRGPALHLSSPGVQAPCPGVPGSVWPVGPQL